jgi:glycosyltransferase involved in cell wall biosynthesis
MGPEEKLLAQLEEKAEWIELAEQSLAECQSELAECQSELKVTVGKLKEAEQSLADRQSELNETVGKLKELERVLEEITNSASWKVAERFSQVSKRIAPPGTGRRRLLNLAFRGRGGMPQHRWDQPADPPSLRQDVAARLDTHPQSPEELAPIAHRPGRATPPGGQVLIIDHRLPTPDRDSGSFRMMEMIRAILARGHHVSFIPNNLLVWSPYLEALEDVGAEVVSPPSYSSVTDYLKQRGRDFHLAILCRAEVAARHMTAVKRFAPQARIVFDTVDLCFLREERQARVEQDPSRGSAAAARKQQELRLAIRADRTLVVSPIERAILQAEWPEIDVRIIPNMYPVEETDPPGFESRRDIVFIGGFLHVPNVDAVLFFAKEIYPRFRARIPDTVFRVIGPDAPAEICQLAGPDIEILGYVPDVRPIFDRARVSVAPLRYGAGVKGKVNQSMLLGVPTVVTSMAAEGMYLVHEQDALIADDPESFADAVVRLWTSRELWERVSTNGRRNLREHFSVEAAAQALDDLLQWAGLPLAG